MGDGQHIWAAAQWLLMVRNCFVCDEGKRIVLASGIPQEWLEQRDTSFGRTLRSRPQQREQREVVDDLNAMRGAMRADHVIQDVPVAGAEGIGIAGKRRRYDGVIINILWDWRRHHRGGGHNEHRRSFKLGHDVVELDIGELVAHPEMIVPEHAGKLGKQKG